MLDVASDVVAGAARQTMMVNHVAQLEQNQIRLKKKSDVRMIRNGFTCSLKAVLVSVPELV